MLEQKAARAEMKILSHSHSG